MYGKTCWIGAWIMGLCWTTLLETSLSSATCLLGGMSDIDPASLSAGGVAGLDGDDGQPRNQGATKMT